MSVSGRRAKVQENIPVPVLDFWIPPPRLRSGVSQPSWSPWVGRLGCSRWEPLGQGQGWVLGPGGGVEGHQCDLRVSKYLGSSLFLLAFYWGVFSRVIDCEDCKH